MKKKTLLATLLFVLVAVLAFTLAACDDDEPVTLESLQNDYGVSVTGGGFTEGTTLSFRQIVTETDEGANILAAIDGQSYNKEEPVYIFEIYATQNDQRVQPAERVEVSLPRPAPVSTLRQYLLFQVDEGGCSEILNPRFTKETVAFATHTLSYFVIAQKPHEHVYTRVEATASTCTEAGTVAHYHCNGCNKNFDDSYAELASVAAPLLPHDAEGNYSPRVEATFFMEGTVAYYICNDCLQYIGEDGQIIPPADIVIPRLSLDLSIYVNNVPTQLVLLDGDHSVSATWELQELVLTVGDVITIRPTDDPSVYHRFTSEGYPIQNGHIVYSASKARVTLIASEGVLHLYVEDLAPCEHEYTYVEGSDATCTETGIYDHYHCDKCGRNFNPNYVEIPSIIMPTEPHEYGSMYWGKSANFWEDGNIEYYQCSECGKYFDEEYNEIETPVIPKYSANLSICVNGVPTALVIEEQTDGHIVWTLESLSVRAGDVITICQTDDPTVTHSFWGDGNVDDEGVINNTAEAAEVILYASPNGLMLTIGGYKYEGIVIEINGVQYPMNYVTYSDEQTTGYIYGLVPFAAGDKFVIVDNVSGTVYDYDDLSDSRSWNTWDFHRGDNGEFVIDNAGRYGIEFDGDVTREIYIDKHFAPLDGGYYEVVLEGEEQGEPMQGLEAPEGSDIYESIVWYYMHDSVMNADDILAYIEEKGLHIYTLEMVLAAGAKLNIKTGAGTFITADHLTDVNADEVCVTKEGDYVKILTDGVYMITYLPAYNAFGIYKTEEALPDAYIYCNDGFLPLAKDADNVVTHEGLVAGANDYVAFMDGTKTRFLPITLDDGTDSTIAHVMENEGAYMLFFDKAGTYDLAYNVETGELSITVADGNGGRDPSVTYGFYLITTDGAGGGGSYSLTVCDDNADEYCIKNFVITQGYFMNVTAIGNDQSMISYYELADTDASIAQNVSTLIMICADGTYDIYFNTQTNTVRIVASAS